VHISEHILSISQHVPVQPPQIEAERRHPTNFTNEEQTQNNKKVGITANSHLGILILKKQKIHVEWQHNSSTHQLSNHPNETSIRAMLIARNAIAIKSAIH
jgi:hypothetical protein